MKVKTSVKAGSGVGGWWATGGRNGGHSLEPERAKSWRSRRRWRRAAAASGA